MNAITQSTLAKPDTSWRRKRSPDTTISNQNHSMNMNIVKASAMKLPNVNPPSNNIALFPSQSSCDSIDQCGRKEQRPFVRLSRGPVGGWRGIAHAGLSPLQPARGRELIRL